MATCSSPSRRGRVSWTWPSRTAGTGTTSSWSATGARWGPWPTSWSGPAAGRWPGWCVPRRGRRRRTRRYCSCGGDERRLNPPTPAPARGGTGSGSSPG
ncbi:hypothetical protein [Ornithinimicrobium kibberense]|uniref:hypothetical protein n=1 Tax=Ornithinimicrobium kibberense TaxID=282060 RepID=UPI00360F1F7A